MVSDEASGSNQGHNTLLSPTNLMRYMPGVVFMHQQYHKTSKENNLAYDPQIQEKKSIYPGPSATRRCNFHKGKGHYALICNEK